MFSHVFVNRLKCLLRDRTMLFWTLLFPLLLATLFNLAFSKLQDHEIFETIPLGVVQNDAYAADKIFQNTLSALSEKDAEETPLFELKLTKTKEEADGLLKEGKISGYIVVEDKIRMVVRQSGLNQTIIKAFVDEYQQHGSVFSDIIKENPQAIGNGLLQSISQQKNFIREGSSGDAAPNTFLNYFYTLIAMSCLYGGFFGVREIQDIQADLSAIAARTNLAPVSKLKMFFYRSLAAATIHFAEILILLAYLRFGLGIDFGAKVGMILLTCFIGSLTGVSFGLFVGAVVKKSDTVKTAILTAGTMTLCFLAGMMFQDMKYIVSTKAPVLAYINPANLLTDAFYALYYYDTYTRFFVNISLLVVFTIVFSITGFLIVRRQKYASI